MKPILFASLAAAALVAGCNKPAAAPEAPAPEATAPAPEAVAPEAAAPAAAPAGVVGADLPTDNSTPAVKAEIEKVTGIPDEVRFGDEIVGLVEYRDGTIIDAIRMVL